MKTKGDFPAINERPPEGTKDDGSKFRVLVVDDSMFVAKQLGQILASEGYEVVATAGDGKEGVDKYKELCPNVDIVTMDITMPRMDGITALEQITASAVHVHPPSAIGARRGYFSCNNTNSVPGQPHEKNIEKSKNMI